MPLVNVTTSRVLEQEQVEVLSADLCRAVNELTGKPEGYIMVAVHNAHVSLGCCEEPAALVEFKSIGGVGPNVNGELTRRISTVLEKHLGTAASRVYVTFTDFAAADWGWNNGTFG